MEKFNIDVFYTNIESLGAEYLIYKDEKLAIEKCNNIDTKIRQLKSFIGMSPIDENSRQLIKLRKYQKLYFNVLKEKEKHLRGVKLIYTCLIDNIEMRVFYAKKDIYMTILEALDKLVREISEYTEAPNKKNNSQFSVLEWATIFYYAYKNDDYTKEVIESISKFIKKHNITTSSKNLKNKYYEAIKGINTTNNYSIEKLEKIKPFLKKNYKKTYDVIKDDIDRLKYEKKERDDNDDYQ